MKHTSISQSFNTALFVLIGFLLAGVALALWVEHTKSSVNRRTDTLSEAKDRIANDLMVMSDALRGQLLSPKNELEKNRRRNAENELRWTANAIESDFREYGDLTKSVKEAREFVAGPLGGFQRDVADLAENDPPGAITYYNRNCAAINQQRDKTFSDMVTQVDHVKKEEEGRAQSAVIIGLICLSVILIASLLVVRFQSVTIAEPLNRLVATLERMRLGDFTQRLDLNRKDEFGVLNEGLNRLADDLSSLVGQVQRSGIQVNTTTTEIAATAKEQQSTAHEIAATTAQIGATSKEISATSKELVKTMNEVNHVAEETAHLAGSGQTAISRMEAYHAPDHGGFRLHQRQTGRPQRKDDQYQFRRHHHH